VAAAWARVSATAWAGELEVVWAEASVLESAEAGAAAEVGQEVAARWAAMWEWVGTRAPASV